MVLFKFFEFLFDLLISAAIVLSILLFLSNPTSEQLEGELRASFHKEVGDDVASVTEGVLNFFGNVNIQRKNYYLFSYYSVYYKPAFGKPREIGHYLGIAGEFIDSNELVELEEILSNVSYDELTVVTR